MNHPRIIWTLWYQGIENAPDLVKQCVDSWRRLNPGYTVNVLDRDSLSDHVEFPREIDLSRKDIPVQKVAALGRLALLKEHGGVWADATVHCCRALDDWLPEYLASGFFAFRNPGADRMMSNWFMASVPGSVILEHLHREFTSFFMNNRFEHLSDKFGKQAIAALSPLLNRNHETTLLWFSEMVTKGLKVYPYFIFHYTFNKVILENRECRDLWSSSPALEADLPHAMQSMNAADHGDSTARALEHISSGISPVYKLNWREDPGNAYWRSVLNRLREL